MVICLERGANLHMAQRMPLSLTVSCFSKIQILTRVVPERRPLNVCVRVSLQTITIAQMLSIGHIRHTHSKSTVHQSTYRLLTTYILCMNT